MVDLNNNALYSAKKIFFESKKIFVLNLVFFLIIALLFGLGQHYFQKKNGLLYKHTIIIENVPIIPTNNKFIKTKNFKIQYKIVAKTYPENNFQVFDVYGKLFNNSIKEISEIENGMINFVDDNIQRQIEKINLNLNLFREEVLSNPLQQIDLELKNIYLDNMKYDVIYSIERNNLNQIISRSFIISFVILLLIRIFYNEVKKLKKNKI